MSVNYLLRDCSKIPAPDLRINVRGLSGVASPEGDEVFTLRAGAAGASFRKRGRPGDGANRGEDVPTPPASVTRESAQLLHIYGLDTEPYTVLEDPAAGEFRFWGRGKRLVQRPSGWTVAGTQETQLLDPVAALRVELWLSELARARVDAASVAAAPRSDLENPDFTSFFRSTLNQRKLRERYASGVSPIVASYPCGGSHEQGRAVDINTYDYSDDELNNIPSDQITNAQLALRNQQRLEGATELAAYLPTGSDRLIHFGVADRVHYDMDPVAVVSVPDQARVTATNQAQLDYRFIRHLAGDPAAVPAADTGNWAPIIHCRYTPNNPAARLAPQ